jgi:FtsH-binding integral membrane protein
VAGRRTARPHNGLGTARVSLERNLKMDRRARYNLGRISLSQDPSNSPHKARPRRWSVISAGLLLLALALVVIYTSRPAFSSPLALVVVASIGLVALLLQLRFRNQRAPVRASLWLNVVGLLFAIAAVFADHLHFSSNMMLGAALGAVICFGISGFSILRELRKPKS